MSIVSHGSISEWPDHGKEFPTKAARSAAYWDWAKSEDGRIAQQRGILDRFYDGALKIELIAAMLDRANWLLEQGFPDEADQLLEFIPERYVAPFLNWYFSD
jgi:hypothetical protein